ncbi:hypothetical protein O3S80_04165 [Streptomyces sp. Lzd4kr]|nr:hypothetical protein [Streptomyces sp. Lzd4kr]
MTHTPDEWAQMVSLAFGVWGTCSVFYFLLVDADRADFNPRPALETGRLAPAWQVTVHAGHEVVWGAVSARHHVAPQVVAVRAAVVQARRFPRDAALSVAALLALLLPASGGTR